jgi:Protein of unknown function (DUF3047)
MAFLAVVCAAPGMDTIADDIQKDLWVGRFSTLQAGMDAPPEWEPLVFKKIERHTRYERVSDEGVVVIKAVSDAAASGLIRKIEIDPLAYPIVEWRWKVGNILEKGDVTQKKGDDYPARIYITFAYDPSKLSFNNRIKYKAAKLIYGEYPPTGAINYIWGNHVAVDTIIPNPYTDRAMMIAVESGAEKTNQWVTQRRNLLEDYRKAFHTEPPPISGVAIMTDTDNTGASATAFYGDIIFKQLPEN